VKQLAAQTARSTAEIVEQIAGVRASTGASVEAVTQIERTIGEISIIASAIAAAVERQDAATNEIARNVAETAAAANEMTDRIEEMSDEAERTGTQAAAVLDHTAALRASVDDLRRSVIRVVRTATPDVDRRQFPRFAVDRPGRLTVAGRPSGVARVIDLSEGGASLRDAPVLPPGTTGMLEIDGVMLPFRALAEEAGLLHIVFMADAAAAAAFRPILARLGRPIAA
jgi:hypothetical protein